jgi:ABC-2 type transport system permease protein
MEGNLINAYQVSYAIISFLWIHIPLLIVLVTGDLIAGEEQAGTLRIVLSRPVSRAQLVSAKFVAGIIYSVVVVILLGALSLGVGLIIFGKGDLIVIMGSVNIIPEDKLLWRFIAAFAFGALSMATVASLSLLLSSMAHNSLGPILSTMAILIVLNLITTLNIGILESVKPFLLTHYLDSWYHFFAWEINEKKVLLDALVLIIHIAVFYILTLLYFRRKDILS